MLLAALVALVVALPPLLRAGWDTWSLTLIVLAVVSGFGLYMAFQVAVGNLPLPYPNRALAWIVLIFTLVTVSSRMSPVRGLIERDWWMWVIGLWILIAVPLVPEERRDWIERSILAAAWV